MDAGVAVEGLPRHDLSKLRRRAILANVAADRGVTVLRLLACSPLQLGHLSKCIGRSKWSG
jgi:hypothetical protein